MNILQVMLVTDYEAHMHCHTHPRALRCHTAKCAENLSIDSVNYFRNKLNGLVINQHVYILLYKYTTCTHIHILVMYKHSTCKSL